MSQQIINKSLQKTLISPLTSDLLWSQFLEANSYEIANMENRYSEIKNNWNIDKNNKDNLIRISKSFGYTPNLVINNTISMCKKEIESIPYRIREKTTYNGYSLIFQQNGLLGNVFTYYYNGDKLIKSIDYESTLDEIKLSDHYSPFYKIVSLKNVISILNSPNIILDYLFAGEIQRDSYGIRYYSLDQQFNPYWKLDTSYVRIPTKHLEIDYLPLVYYCTYQNTLGYGVENTNEYETQISLVDNYIDESIKVIINNKNLDLIITTQNDKEYLSDSENILNSDSFYDKINGNVYLKFNIIPINYEIIISYDVNIFITSDYFYYLEQGVDYTKRCPIVPHTGVFLTADILQCSGSDYYHPNENHYTVPDLKLKAQTTSAYNRFITFGNQETESLIEKFKYIASGNKALPIFSEEYSQIFDMQSLEFYYNMNDENDSSIIRDCSNNELNCNIHGNSTKIDGIIDKSLNFNGDVWASSSSSFNFDSSDNHTLGIWFNADVEPPTSTECLFDSFINISYDYENEKLIIESTQFDCSKNSPHFLCITFDSSNSIISVFLDGVLLNTMSYGTYISNNIYIGVDNTLNNAFYGIIDNLWLLSKVLDNDEIEYINDNKITLITHMGNKLNYYELAKDELFESDDYFMIQSYIKGMDVTNESHLLNNDSEIYTFNTNNYPILNSYFNLIYQNISGESVILKTNEKGQIYNEETGEIITGNINFKNGNCNITKDSIKSKSQMKIDSPKKTLYENAYCITDNNVITWYATYIPSTDSYDDPITNDDVDTSSSTSYLKISVYTENDDRSVPQVNLYSSDEENYYLIIYNALEDKNNPRYIKSYVANGDLSETKLYSHDNGKSLYMKLENLKTDIPTNQLKAYVDLGESSGTKLYSTDNGTTLYIDINALIGPNPNKEVKKVQGLLNGVSTKAYTLGTDSIYYTDLTFTSTVDLTSVTPEPWNLMEFIISCNQVDLNLTLQETREIYTNVYAIEYISDFTKQLITSDIDIIRRSVTFNYWIEIHGKLEKCIGTVSYEGVVSGINIASGSFDYDTNILTVQFIDKIKSDIVTSFEYYYSLDIDTTKPILVNYKMESSKINEIGLEDENHELLAYMTFQDIEFHSIYNNVSVLFAICRNPPI